MHLITVKPSSRLFIAHKRVWPLITLAVLAGALVWGAAQAWAAPGPRILSGLKVPFVANQGQSGPEIAYYAQTLSGNILVLRNGRLAYRFHSKQNDDIIFQEIIGLPQEPPLAFDPSEARVNILKGRDQAKWRRNLPTFHKVNLGRVAPGVRVELHAQPGNVEKFFHFAPGSRPQDLRVSFQGARALQVLPSGELEVDTAQGAVRFSRPKAFQNIAGRQVPVEVAYQSQGLNYGFHLGDYDPAHEVVVDPAVSWATYLGGSLEDHAYAVTMGENGYIYVAGRTQSSDFQPTLARSHSGDNDAFLVKVKPDGTDLVFATLVGGTSDDEARSVAVDERGVALITGNTSSQYTFPQVNTLQDWGGGAPDAFIVRFNASGSDLVIATFVGGSSSDYGYGITVDEDKNFYVVGSTYSTDFLITTGPTHAGESDVFIMKVSSGGTQFWSRLMGGTGNDIGYDIAVDEEGNTYIAGSTSGDFDPIINAFQDTIGGYDPENPEADTNDDAFVAKLNSDVTSVIYSSYLGGSQYEVCYGLYVKDQAAYLVGVTESDDLDFSTTPTYLQNTRGGLGDILIAKVTHTSGDADLAYLTYLGGAGDDIGWDITLDHEDNIYVVGETTGSFTTVITDMMDDTFQPTYGGGYLDAVMAMIAPDGSSVVYASYLGGSLWDSARGVAVDSDGIVYIVGETRSEDFPDASSSTIQSTYGGGNYDAFVVAINSGDASPEPVETPTIQILQPSLLPILRTQ